MTPLIQRKEDVGEDKCNHNGAVTHKDKNQPEEERNDSTMSKGNVATNQINIDAVVEPVLKIQIEPPSNTSEKNESSEIKTKVYLKTVDSEWLKTMYSKDCPIGWCAQVSRRLPARILTHSLPI